MLTILSKVKTYSLFTTNKLFVFVLNVNVIFKQIVSYIFVYYNKANILIFFDSLHCILSFAAKPRKTK